MPNHCENDLYIYDYDYENPDAARARVDEVLQFMGATGDKPEFRFETLIPVPVGISHENPDALSETEWHWRVEHWGTKWDAYEVTVERKSVDTTIVHFRTAWAPPKPVFVALAAKFPRIGLCLEYFERGMEFCGGMRRDEAHDDDGDPEDIRTWQGPYGGLRGG